MSSRRSHGVAGLATPEVMKLSGWEYGVLVVAFGVRLCGLWSMEQTAYATHPLVDAQTYWQQAQQLLGGEDPFGDGLYQPPGYPVLLAIWGKLSGGTLTLSAVRWVQLCLGWLTSLGLLLLGRRLGKWSGCMAVLLHVLYARTLLFESDILTPSVTGFALVWALICIQSPRWLSAAIGGVLSGLAVVCHPTYLLAAIWLGVCRVFGSDGRRAVAAFGVGLLLALAPTTIRNVQDFGRFKLVSHNAGLNLYLASNPGWRTTSFLPAGLGFRQLALEAEPHMRDVAERDVWWRQRALGEIRDHPDAWAAAVMTRALWSVNDVEVPRNEDYRCRFEAPALAWMGWMPVRYGWVFPFAFLGGVTMLRRRDRLGGMWVGTWVLLHVPMVVFLVADRYRLATWPLLCLLAPVGMTAVRTAMRRPSWMWAGGLVFVLPWLPTDDVTHKDPARCLHVQGNLAFMDGEKEKAAELYRASLALDPSNITARSYLASMASQGGDLETAHSEMLLVLQDFPDHFPSLKLMSSIQKKRGEISLAADYMGRAYRVPGERTSTGVRYVLLLLEAGRRDEALEVVQASEALQRQSRIRDAFRQHR